MLFKDKMASIWHRGGFYRCLLTLVVLVTCYHSVQGQSCPNNPCRNGATCQLATLDPGYVCLCPQPYIGRQCETPISDIGVENPAQCSRGFFSASGRITSPNYPSQYTDNEFCIFSIRIAQATAIILTFDFFQTEEFKDELFTRPRPDVNVDFFNNPSLWGNQSGLVLTYNNTNQVSLVWESDFNIPKAGFEISYGTDPCYLHQCLNGASCIPDSNGLTYTCVCPSQFTGQFCASVLVLVSQTVTTPSNAVVEGKTLQTVNFDLTFTPHFQSTQFVIGSGLWRVDAFFSTVSSGLTNRLGEVQAILNSTQTQESWLPPLSTTIQSIQANIIVNRALCSQMRYICARIGRGFNPSIEFQISGVPTDNVLIGCSLITCRGVEITSTLLSITSGSSLREGFAGQEINFDVDLASDASAGSVQGTGLWKVTVFGSASSTGSGTRSLVTPVTLSSAQANANVIAGILTQLRSMRVQWSVQNGVTCSDIQYFCVLVEKGDSPSPDYLLSRAPQVACQRLTCTGVQVIDTSLAVNSGTPLVENAGTHTLNFDLSINTNPNGGRVIGSNLWTVQLYASSSNVIGSGSQTTSVPVTLTSVQSGVDITPGVTATLRSVSGVLNLSGSTCATLSYVCAVLGRNTNSNPDFTLTPVPSTDVLTSCTSVSCNGVLISSVGYTITAGQPIQAGSAGNLVILNFNAVSLNSGASASGQNLWQVQIFTNTQSNGLGTSSLSQVATFPTGVENTPLVAGSTLNLNSIQTIFDLTPFTCAQIPFLCVRLSKRSGASPDFTLTPVLSSSLVSCQRINCNDRDPCLNHQCQNGATCLASGTTFNCQCAPGWTDNLCQTPIDLCQGNPCENGGTCENFQTFFTCTCPLGWEGDRCQIIDQGVIMQMVQLIINSGTLRQGISQNAFNFDINLVSNALGDSVSGTGLWQLSIFPNSLISGLGTTAVTPVTPTLTAFQAGTSLAAGSQATISNVAISLNLQGVSCMQVPYLCVRVAKGPNPNPNFLLTGLLVGCIPSQCRGVEITNTVTTIGSGTVLDENSATNPVTFTLSIITDISGGSVSGSNLWSINTFLSNQNDGGGTRIAFAPASLTTGQASTSVPAGSTTAITGINANIDLTGVDCSRFQYFCVELRQSTNPSPAFMLTPTSSISCTQVPCSGVQLTNVQATIDSGLPLSSGQQNVINFDLSASSNQNGASISGTNLWQVLVYTSSSSSGGVGAGSAQQFALLSQTLRDLTFTAGGTVQFNNLQATLDLSNLVCSNPQYICVQLQRDPSSSVTFTLTGTDTHCQIVNCQAPLPCTGDPCLNGATCSNRGDSSFFCNCLPEWVGLTCNIDNPCLPQNPCLNSGTCLPDNSGTFDCLCFNGYTGDICEISPDPCLASPCRNGGTCSRVGTTSNFQCTCVTGYSGLQCENINRCILDNPCRNGATCVPDLVLGTFQCICPQGFKGTQCQFTDSCFPNPCLNLGTCVSDSSGQSFTCSCRPENKGPTCQYPEPCVVSPCLNSGTCSSSFDGSVKTCVCPPQFSGNNCQFTNPCFPNNPCANGGTCTLDATGAVAICQCPPGFVGSTCQLISPCQGQPCQNGGTCVVSQDGQTRSCLCPSNPTLWTGPNCNTPVVCASLPCQNGGTCLASADLLSFVCQCPPGFSGSTCLTIDACSTGPCLNGGTCRNVGTSFECTCPSGFLGLNCQNSDPCQPNPCGPGTCTPISQGLLPSCSCPPGYSGSECQFRDGCIPNPCQNSGICQSLDFLGNFQCVCAPGFTGSLCTLIDPCSRNPSPCQNGGSCFNDITLPSGYRCVCTPQYTGTNCDLTNFCNADPCHNGGTCVLLASNTNFECMCTADFIGDRCDVRNPCSPNPCLNGGSCNINMGVSPPTATCICPTDFTGTNCQTPLIICANPTDFQCSNGDCIAQSLRCNNILNCVDNSDELGCPIPCLNGMFQCTSVQVCITSLLTCDGINHCPDGSDEGSFCQMPCNPNPCLNGGTCNPSGSSFTCTCAPSFTGPTCILDDVNNAPFFNYFVTPTFVITENQSPTILVGTLDATDPDGDPLTYGLVDSISQSLFTINATSGELYAKPGIDREVVGSFPEGLRVSVSDGENTVLQAIFVEIRDVNDNAPFFNNLPNTVSVYENETFGAELFQVNATDIDLSVGSLITFAIGTVTPIVPGTVSTDYFGIGVSSGTVLLATTLDFETVQQYFVAIVARDYGSSGTSLSSTSTLTVNVLDVQDTAPTFVNGPFDVSVPETTPVTTIIQTVTAQDQDSISSNPIVYSFVLADSQGYFAINRTTGEITVIRRMDRDNTILPANFTVIVQATEIGSGGSSSAQTSFTIRVTPANDEPPAFDPPAYFASVPENAQFNFVLLSNISVNDGDFGTDSTVSITLQNSNILPFDIAPTTIVGNANINLRVDQALDFETTPSYDLQLFASDSDGQSTASVTVTVTDVNDNDPIFLNIPANSQFRGTIDENAPSNTPIIQLMTSDADTGINAVVQYSITGGNANNAFTIDSNGWISNNVILSSLVNQPQVYTLTVTASNPVGPVPPATGQTSATVVITVQDVNDNAPQFAQDEYTTMVSEATQIGTTIYRLTASDADIPEGDQLTYAVIAGNGGGFFDIIPQTGDVFLLRLLDRETEPQHNLTIRAVDQAGQTDTARLTVIVTDFNDNSPRWDPNSFSVTTTIREDATPGAFVVKVNATDLDLGLNAVLTFAITSPNDQVFTIDSNGNIYTATPLDRETTPQYNLLITALDNGNPQRAANPPAVVTVIVTDANDEAPTITQAPYAFTVSEDASLQTFVGQITASDPDTTGTLTFAFTTPQSDFIISPSGEIRTSALLDTTTRPSYQMMVVASDGVRQSLPALVTITVLDVNNQPPVFGQQTYVRVLPEDSPFQTLVATLMASDMDSGNNGNIIYGFQSLRRTEGPFTVDPFTGVVETSASLDRETQDFYSLIVIAVDQPASGPSMTGTATVQVTITDVNDNAPMFRNISYEMSVFENIATGSNILTVMADDPDLGENGRVLYQILSGNDNDMFTIDSQGNINLGTTPLDRETQDRYFLIVQAYNTNRTVGTDQAAVIINVLDVNDEIPRFQQVVYARPDLSENSAINTPVLTVFALDPDLNLGGEVQYSLVGNPSFLAINPTTGVIFVNGPIPPGSGSRNYTMTVRVTDRASPFLSSTSSVVVTVIDAGQEIPQFLSSLYQANVSENVGQNTFVTQVTALLGGSSAGITYGIDPNANPIISTLFRIEPTTGIIRTNGDIDREAGDFYAFTVFAYNGATAPGSTSVWVSITDLNDNAPEFVVTPTSPVFIQENQQGTVTIGQISAIDADAGVNGQVTYSITGIGSNLFQILNSNQQGGADIVAISPLDRESQDFYQLTIVATDGGVPPLSSSFILDVNVTDVNDNVPFFTNAFFTGSITENNFTTNPLVTVTVRDSDLPSSNNFEYSITAGDPEGLFSINENGEVTLTGLLDRETQATYQLTVQLQDASNTPTSLTTTTVLITVLDQNDNTPMFQAPLYVVNVTEGPFIAPSSVIRVIATDDDVGVNGDLTYAISSQQPAAHFQILASNGLISTAAALDWETIPVYTLIVTSADQAVTDPKTGTATVIVNVIDTNDSPPRFGQAFYGPYPVQEGIPGSYIDTFQASDADQGDAGSVIYSISGLYSDFFNIEPSTGVLTIKRDRVLDYETITGFNITLIATDRGIPSLSSSTIVGIDVINTNDHSPMFEGRPYAITISRNVSSNSLVYIIRATDGDVGPFGDVNYAIIEGNALNLFRIDNMTGEIFLTGPINTGIYPLIVAAIDNPGDPSNSRSQSATVTITVSDVLDLAPSFPGSSVFLGSVFENTPLGQPVAMIPPIQAVDGDATGQLMYSIQGNDSLAFIIHPDTAMITVNAMLDREVQSYYAFTVRATDTTGLFAEGTVNITILDINDFDPTFSQPVYNFTIPETANGGFLVGQVFGMDSDGDGINFFIQRGGEDKFEIDPTTGVITVAPGAQLDREQKPIYILTLSISDLRNPPRSTTATVNVYLTDVNDSPPSFDASFLDLVIAIPEDTANDTLITTVVATDRDTNASIQYNVVSVTVFDPLGNDITSTFDYTSVFDVGPTTGNITLIAPVDREVTAQFVFSISAVDLNSQEPAYATSEQNAQVTIDITDINDNAPVFQPPGTTVIFVQFPESFGAGSPIPGSIVALDPDFGVNGMVTYMIAGDTSGLPVVIDPTTGQLTLQVAIDREVQPWVNFTLLAIDGGNPSLNTSIPVTIAILDNNDNNPVFEFPRYDVSVNESESAGAVVIGVVATDGDVGGNGLVTYSLIGGNGKFTINVTTGVITLLEPLDKETQSEYTLIVTAQDNPGDSEDSRSSSTTVVITVTDTNEHPPEPAQNEFPFTIAEGGGPGDVVGVIVAVDPDSPDDPNQSLIYVITGAQPPVGTTWFTINSTTGQIVTTGPLDRDNSSYPSVIYLNVTIYDGGNPNLETTVVSVITIEDINDNVPVFEQPIYPVQTSESEFGDTIITVVAMDPDQNSDLTFAIIGGNTNSTFLIDSNTGEIRPIKPLDYETTTTYNLTVQVTDSGGQSSVTYVVINVTDANDRNPVFLRDPYGFSIAENEPPASVVGVVTAIDGDTDPRYADIIYTILSSNYTNIFSINQSTGAIQTLVSLDREQRSSYVLQVGAYNPQPTTGGFTATSTVSILVRDVNDNAPTFQQDPYRSVLTSSIGNIQVYAEDPDLDENGIVFYYIVSGNDMNLFVINNRTGVISVANPLDSPLVRDYTLIVVARDDGTPSLQSNVTVFINVSYLGTNNPPRFLRPTQDQRVPITENGPVGAFVFQAFAVDNDFGDNGVVVYSLSQVRDYASFSIDPATGNITILVSADRETQEEYELTVIATDQGDPQLSSRQSFVVVVLDENDNDPYFPRPNGDNNPTIQPMDIVENANLTDEVGRVIPAIDPDENPVIYYFIVAGNEDGLFVINSTTRIITVNGTLDREVRGSYTIIVHATNNASFVPGPGPYNVVTDTSLQEVQITLVDVNDNGPVFPQTMITAGVPLEAPLSSSVITLNVFDPDSGGALGDITYEIQAAVFVDRDGVRTAAPTSFIIESSTGRVLTNQLFTQTHLQGYFDLVILATDNVSGLSAVATLRIYVLDNNQQVVVVVDADLETVRNNQDILIEVLQNITGGIVRINDITNYRDDNGNIHTDMTSVLIHVINATTGEVVDATVVTTLIDENRMSIEVLLDKLNVVEVFPLFGGGGLAGIGILEAALLAFALLLFLGALIFIIILCCLRRRLLRKIQGGGVVLGKSHNDLMKDTHAYQGSNPLWLENDASQADDWPDSLSLLGGGGKDYEAQEAIMHFASDEVPIERAQDAVVMTSLVSDKSLRNKSLNGGVIMGNGIGNGSISIAKRVDTMNISGSPRMNRDGYASVHLQRHGAEQDALEDDVRYTSFQSSVTKSVRGRDETDNVGSRYSGSTKSNITRGGTSSLSHRKILTEQTAAEIREMLQDMPASTVEQEADVAAAAYREQMAFENELTPITEEESVSSRSTRSKASERYGRSDHESLERNKRGNSVTKVYMDPMAKFSGESTMEEHYKKEKVEREDSTVSTTSYSAKRTSSKVYSGHDMQPIPELDSADMLESGETRLAIRDEGSSGSGSSGPHGRSYSYQVLRDSGGDGHSVASRTLSTNSSESGSRTGEFTLHVDDSPADEDGDADVIEERRVRRTIKRETNLGGSYRNYGFNDEESAL